MEWLWEIVCEVLLGIVEIGLDDGLIPNVGETHLVLSEGACFIGAYHCCPTHCLAGRHLSDEVLILKHLFGGVSQGKGDSERESLGDSYNDHSDANDEVAEQFTEMPVLPIFVGSSFDGES